MRSTCVVLCIACGVVPVATGQDPKTLVVPVEKTQAATVLVARLTDDDTAVQSKAEAELAKMGRQALPALLAAVEEKPSDERMERLNALLPAARKADFDARAELFLADTDRRFQHDLPGWNQLRAAVDDTKEARKLFADILKDNSSREMLLQAVDVRDDAVASFRRRWNDKHEEWVARCRAELLAGLTPAGNLPNSDDPITWVVSALLADVLHHEDYLNHYRHPVVRDYLAHTTEGASAVAGKGRYGEVVQKFVRHWVEQQKGRHGATDATAIAQYMKFDAAVAMRKEEELFELMVTSGQVNGGFVQLAASRDPKYIPTFRRLFDSDKPYLSAKDGAPLGEIQMRDAALSMCIALSGQDPTAYGFSASFPATAKDDLRYYVYNYYFEAGEKTTVEQKRKAAFEKWAEWEKDNPVKLKATPPEKK